MDEVLIVKMFGKLYCTVKLTQLINYNILKLAILINFIILNVLLDFYVLYAYWYFTVLIYLVTPTAVLEM